MVGSRDGYVVGWTCGPTGVVGTDEEDRQDMADALLAALSDTAPAYFGEDHSVRPADWLAYIARVR